LAATRPAHALLDPDHEAALQVEPALVGRAPAAELLVGDAGDAGTRRVLRRKALRDLRADGPPARLAEERLSGVALREADERVRRVTVLARLDHRDRELDQHRL